MILTAKSPKKERQLEESYFIANQWQLMWRKFKKHRLAAVGGTILAILYTLAIFCEFFAPYDIYKQDTKHIYVPPQKVHFFDSEGRFHIRPFVYDIDPQFDPETLDRIYPEVKDKIIPIRFFVRGDEYKFWGLFRTNIHFFGVKEGVYFPLGTDMLGRCILSRIIYGARISLSIGFIGVILSFILGCIIGGISGFYGGGVDMVIQRIIDFLISLPLIPLWLALSAALPSDWSPIRIYFFITIILSIFGWCGLARVVRGKIISVREEDYILAARIGGAKEGAIIRRHLLPSFLSYLIVNLTLAIPAMILGETALSFLGIGLRKPVVSWGVLLKDAQNTQTIIYYPWMLIPGLMVIIVVLCFNLLGDGLRDAADPYK